MPASKQQSKLFPIPASSVMRAESTAPCLLVCDHASNFIPEPFNKLGLDKQQLVEHIAWDFGAKQLLEATSKLLNCCAVECQYSRLLIDCNRATDSSSSIPERSEHHDIFGNKDISAENRQQRIDNIFQPYHKTIDAQLRRLKVVHGLFPIVGIHSFTPTFHGQERPWQFSVMWKEETTFANSIIDFFKTHQLADLVGFNEPYSAKEIYAYTTETAAKTHQLPTVVFEVRQDLLASAGEIAYWADIISQSIRHGLKESMISENPLAVSTAS